MDENVREEMDRYLSYPFTTEELKMDVISFWSKYSLSFQSLSQMAFYIHSIPATNLSSERIFNYAGLTITDRRSSLDPQGGQTLVYQI